MVLEYPFGQLGSAGFIPSKSPAHPQYTCWWGQSGRKRENLSAVPAHSQEVCAVCTMLLCSNSQNINSLKKTKKKQIPNTGLLWRKLSQFQPNPIQYGNASFPFFNSWRFGRRLRTYFFIYIYGDNYDLSSFWNVSNSFALSVMEEMSKLHLLKSPV